ncbi:MAG: YfhO family protein [Deltaproteobacteria bacterium]|nr:YfhO family protein [Deltaproteobacteria bacterium]
MNIKNLSDKIAYLIIILLPALILFWLVPFYSEITIGNDYTVFPISQQMEIAYSLEHNSFPLYAPGFAMGRSQAALTMAQTFHPIIYLSSLTPGYWDGNALSINTLYRLLFLAFAHLFLFVLLRRVKMPVIPSFIISLITVYNMRMLDLFRYGSSLENYTGYLFLCASIGLYYIKPSKFSGPLAIIISTYLLITGGHPQMMYFGLLGAGSATLFIPFILTAIDPSLKEYLNLKKVLSFYILTGAWVGAGLLISMPYVASFYLEFVKENALRVGQDYAWSLAYNDTAGGILNSLLSPMESDVHCAFGGSNLILIALLAPLAFLAGKKTPFSIIALTGVIALIILAATGDSTPVHRLFWENVPLANTFRTPGRISMMLPFLIFLSAGWLFSPNDSNLFLRKLPFNRLALPALISLAGIYIYHNYLQQFLPLPSRYTPHTIIAEKMRDMDLLNLYDKALPISYYLGILTMGLTFLYSVNFKYFTKAVKATTAILLLITVTFQVTTVLRFGTWQTKSNPYPTLEQMNIQKESTLNFKGSPGFGMEYPQVTEQMKNSTIEPKLARFYQNYIGVKDHEEAIAAIATGKRNSVTAVIEGSSKNNTNSKINKIDTIDLTYSSFNKVEFKVNAQKEGYFTFNYPFDGRWNATVDGKESEVFKANGLENAVFVKSGEHEIQFYYKSKATLIGGIIALLTIIFLGIMFSFINLKNRQRWLFGSLSIIIPIIPFSLWAGSFYTGDNLNTKYSWNSNMNGDENNLAFAKPTQMSSIWSFQMPYFYSSSLGVDGDKSGRPFATNPRQAHPYWQVDLGNLYKIGKINVYDNGAGRRLLPLKILLSDNGRRFTIAKEIKSRPPASPWIIDLDGLSGRFVRIQSGGRGSMNLNEIEIFKVADAKVSEPLYNDLNDPTGNLRKPVTSK